MRKKPQDHPKAKSKKAGKASRKTKPVLAVSEWVYEGIDESLTTLKVGLDHLDSIVELYPESDSGYASLIKGAMTTGVKVEATVQRQLETTKAPRRRGAQIGASRKREKLQLLVTTPLDSLLNHGVSLADLGKAALFQAAVEMAKELLRDNRWKYGAATKVRQQAKNNLVKLKRDLVVGQYTESAVQAAMRYARNGRLS